MLPGYYYGIKCELCYRRVYVEQELGTILTPAENSQAINHGSVGIRAHKAVWVIIAIVIKYHSCQILQIHLVDDP